MPITSRQWSIALVAALLAHFAIAAAVLWEPPDSGTKSAGLGGIEISLGPAGGAPGNAGAEDRESEEAKPVQPPETAEETPTPETAETIDAPAADDAEVETASESAETPPVETVETADRIDIVEAAEAEIEIVQAQETKAVDLIPPPPQDTVAKPVEDVTARTPAPAPVPKPRPQPKPPAPVAEPAPPEPPTTNPQTQTATAATLAGSQGRSGTQMAPDAGSADNTAGGGMAGQEVDYMTVLQEWLERHKEYPRRARMRRQQGTAVLYFVMDREGRVLEYRLERSSGHRLLDREVMDMIQRAQPLPKMPDEMEQVRLELVVPIQFFLR